MAHVVTAIETVIVTTFEMKMVSVDRESVTLDTVSIVAMNTVFGNKYLVFCYKMLS